MKKNTSVQPRLLSKEEVSIIVGFKGTKINELVQAGKFPKPIRFSQNFARWDLEEVNQWIEEQKSKRN